MDEYILQKNGYGIRAIKLEDIEWARQVHNEPSVLRMLTDPRPVSASKQRIWFKNLQKSQSSERWIVEYKKEKIGIVRIDEIDHINKSVRIGLDVHKKFRGKGHAKKIYKFLFEHWFEKENMNRIWLMVAEYNEIAYNLYRKLGFKEEGRARQALFRDGKYYDYIIMSILRDEWRSLW